MARRKQDINKGAWMMVLVVGGLAGLFTWSLPVALFTTVALAVVASLLGIIRS